MKGCSWLFSVLLLGGCTSNLYLDQEQPRQTPSFRGQEVFVSNPEIGVAYQLLRESGVYSLSANPQASVTLQLREPERQMICGLPMMASALTLGLLPVSLPERSYFSYSLDEQGRRTTYMHELRLVRRVSVWEWLVKPFAASEHRLKVAALARSPRELWRDDFR